MGEHLYSVQLTEQTSMSKSETFKTSVVGMQGALLSFAMKLTLDLDEADDLVQDTMLKALNNESKFETGTNMKGWMMTIMRNIFINNCRKNSQGYTMVDVTDEAMHFSLPVSSAAEAPDGAIAVKEINAALAVFPAEYRRPFSMFVAGYKYGEISEILKMPMGTVKSHIFLTRKRLRELLKDYR